MFIIYTYIYSIHYCEIFPLFITKSVNVLGLYYNVWDAVSNSSKYNILPGNQLIQLYVHICVYNTGTQT